MTPEQIIGTVLRIGNGWHIRLLGGGGSTTPFQVPAELEARLRNHCTVEVTDGYISRDHLGAIQACYARDFTVYGPADADADADADGKDDTSSEAEERRRAIVQELTKAEPDWRMIEAASRAAVDSDPDALRFSVDAAHIQRLGEQLVSKQETALSELIKNAYDADATEVTLEFRNYNRVGGTLSISDNGTGMTEAVIRSSWMRISTTHKADTPRSPIYDRLRAGRKGIGRFSVQRLGQRLRFISRPAGETVGFRADFAWDEAFRPGVSLSEVFSRMERFDKAPEDQGTTLEILDLRDAWSPAAIERVWKAVVLLQAPFPISAPDRDGGGVDPGFQVFINDVSRDKQTELFSIQSAFLDRATAEIVASIASDGTATVHLRSAKLDIDEVETNAAKFLLTGPVALESRYFIFDPALLSGMSQAAAAAMGREFGGIRIYRNGFRVQPYGEPSDDWLNLSFDQARRNLIVPANNANFFGQVAISSTANPLFEETSSREGLIENDAFLELRTFTRWALEWAALRVAAARQRKQRAGERHFTSIRVKPSALMQDLLNRRGGVGSGGGAGTGSAPADDPDADELRRLAQAARDYESDVEAKLAASIEYEEMLRILASLGLSISVFGHEIRGAERAVVANLMVLEDLIADVADEALRRALSDQREDLDRSAGRLFDIGGYIGGLMSRTESRELRDLSVKGSIDRFTRQFSGYMAKQRVSFEIDVEPLELRTTPMHGAELDSVLLNFLTNSIKSMKRAKVADRQVRIEARRVGRLVVIAFEDNGAGISADLHDRVFDPFFTTTMGAEDDGVAGPGTGLGLKIVSDIAASYGGAAAVGEPSDGYTCRMEFSVLAFTGEKV